MPNLVFSPETENSSILFSETKQIIQSIFYFYPHNIFQNLTKFKDLAESFFV